MKMLFSTFIACLVSATAAASASAEVSKAFSLDTTCNSSKLLATPTYGLANASFSVCSEIEIQGTVQQVFNAIIDFANYKKWNTFAFQVDSTSDICSPKDIKVGLNLTFHTRGLLPKPTTSNETVSFLKAPQGAPDNQDDKDKHNHAKDPCEEPSFGAVAWKFNDGNGGKTIQSEHPSVVKNLNNGNVRYVSWQTYYVGGKLVEFLKANLQKEFEIQGEDLKKSIEGALVNDKKDTPP